MSMLAHLLSKNTCKTIPRTFQPSQDVLRQFMRRQSSTTRQSDGTLIVEHTPHPNAPRNAPVPIVFVGSSELDGDGGAFLSLGGRLSREAAARGFMSYQFDLPLSKQADDTAKTLMDRLASNLRALIHSTGIPFPPILYAEQLGCLIAQTYVSSNPLYALILDSPPVSCTSLFSWPGLAERLPLPLPEFTFEPRFPILIMERKSAGGVLRDSRLMREGADYTEICENAGGVESRNVPTRSIAVDRWINELGC